jgi:hypothetical protein
VEEQELDKDLTSKPLDSFSRQAKPRVEKELLIASERNYTGTEEGVNNKNRARSFPGRAKPCIRSHIFRWKEFIILERQNTWTEE